VSDRREIDQLNWLGKAVALAGQGVRLTADLIDSVIDVAAEAYAEAEKAFRQGLDPMIDDADVLEEHLHPPETRSRSLADTSDASRTEDEDTLSP
jgi:hypothetical protein